jgi:hypothetical protein
MITSPASTPRGSPDDQFINIADQDEVRHWSALLEATPRDLERAVAIVGSEGEKVRQYLRQTRRTRDRSLMR